MVYLSLNHPIILWLRPEMVAWYRLEYVKMTDHYMSMCQLSNASPDLANMTFQSNPTMTHQQGLIF